MPVEGDQHIGAMRTKDYPMAKAPEVGHKIKCHACGRKTAARIISTGVQGVIKGKNEIPWNPGERVRTCVNGQEMSFEFVDHPDTDPQARRNLAQMAAANGITGVTAGMSKARFDAKRGQMVVDVASNVPDPLGRLERQKKEALKRGGYDQTKTNVNQSVKRRGNFQSPSNAGALMQRAAAKRAAKKG